jgi:hypothetical protein
LWKDDFQNGIGFENWSDESLFEGEYYKGKKQGFGKIKLNIQEDILGAMGQTTRANGGKTL